MAICQVVSSSHHPPEQSEQQTNPRNDRRTCSIRKIRSTGLLALANRAENLVASLSRANSQAIIATSLADALRVHLRPKVEARKANIYPYSITLSALISSLSGTWIASAFAVPRLMISSNLVGCMMGISAGFSPLRIRPAWTPWSQYELPRCQP